ncbi:hypothetical protein [Haloplanus aerogenes]|uniref:Uncharacterized protein n=1 Tax=Haloplanus aerogenes TaxID=660522 RepID=A0A3M0DRG9_9EURY|nr:hypothetical protein [Haloplanus aerogenes]RMB24221.1 hypothetical protein ATH50_1463 [Haloplanus aerogenes]
MIRTKLVAVVFVALLVTAGTVAAAPGNAPVDVGADDQYDDHAEQADENADDDAENAEDGADNRDDAADAGADNAADEADAGASNAENADRRGPPADLPAQVPDHVAQIHDLIRSFLGSDGDGSLGESVSDATPDEDNADANAA